MSILADNLDYIDRKKWQQKGLANVTPEDLANFAKGSAVGAFALAPDMLGMGMDAGNAFWKYANRNSGNEVSQPFPSGFSGDPIRDLAGTNNKAGLAGEFLDPHIASLKAMGLLQHLPDALAGGKTALAGMGLIGSKMPTKVADNALADYSQHVDIRGRDAGTAAANKESIMRDGFKSNYANTLPIQQIGDNTAPYRHFGARDGDTVYLIPKDAIKNGKIKAGHKPKPDEVLTLEPGESVSDAYARTRAADNALVGELRDVGAKIDDGGMVTVYHATTKESADQIVKSGRMKGDEGSLFFSTKPDGEITGYGDVIIETQVPASRLQLDDVFSDEAHVSIAGNASTDIGASGGILRTLPVGKPRIVNGVADNALSNKSNTGLPTTTTARGAASESNNTQAGLLGDFDARFDPRAKEQERLRSLLVGTEQRVDEPPGINIADLEGQPFVTSMSDRTAAGRTITDINGVPLSQPIDQLGGQGYMFENPGEVWASAKGPTSNIMNEASKIRAETGIDPLYMPWRMAPTGGDFASVTGETMLTYASTNMGKGAKRSLNARMKKLIPGWKGVDDPESLKQFAAAPDKVRKAAKNMMDVEFRDRGGLSIGEARLSVADPNQLQGRDYGLQNVGRIDTSRNALPSSHPSYPSAVPGEGIGLLNQDVSIYELLPEYTKQRGITNPLEVPATTPDGTSSGHMYSLMRGAKSGVITESVLRALQDRGVEIAGMSAAAIMAAAMQHGLIDDTNEGGLLASGAL